MMKKITILAIMIMAATGSVVHAVDWQPLVDNPIALNELNGQTYIVGDKAFSDFHIFGFASGGALAPDPGSIFIQGGINAETGDYGIKFVLGWNAETHQNINANLSFKVSVLPGFDNYISDVEMDLYNASATGSGIVAASETVFDGSLYMGDMVASLGVSKQAGDNDLSISDHQLLAGEPVKEIWISKDVSIAGGAQDNSTASLEGFYQFYSQVPEPMTLSLLALGGLPLLRRKNRKG